MKKNFDILLIDDGYHSQDGGSQHLHALVNLQNKKTYYVDLYNSNLIGIKIASKIIYSRLASLLNKIPIINYIFVKIKYRIYPYIIKYILLNKIKNKYEFKYIWTTTNNILPSTCATLADELNSQLIISCHDLPETFKNSKIEKNEIEKNYSKWINKIKYLEVMTPGMQTFLEEKGLNSNTKKIITYGTIGFDSKSIRSDDNISLKENNFNKKRVEIVYAGSIRFNNEFKIFVSAIEKYNNNKNNSIKIYLTIFSNRKIKDLNEYVIVKDYVERKKLIKYMLNFDYGFVPMSFDINDKKLVSTSIPSKISTYLEAGLKIISMGPDYATNTLLAKNLPESIVINKNLESEIFNHLIGIKERISNNIISNEVLEYFNKDERKFI